MKNLSGEIADQVIVNFDSDPMYSGSFYSATTATNPPISAHAFTGIIYLKDNDNIVIEARDESDTTTPGRKYVREKKGNVGTGVWGPWALDGETTIGGPGGSVGTGNTTADMFYGVTGTAPNSAFIVNSKGNVTGVNILTITKAGVSTFSGVTNFSSNAVVNGEVYAGYGGSTGTIHFGNNAGYYLNWNGSTFTFSEPLAVVGTLNVSGAATVSGAFTANPQYLNANNYAITDGTNYLLHSAGSVYFQSTAGATWGYINGGSANFAVPTNITGALTVSGGSITCQPNYSFRPGGGGNGGFGCKSGDANVTSTDWFNFYWNGSQLLGYVDTLFLGPVSFASDYRIKKDVVDLPGMWDTVKALRPIKYTHQDFTPAGFVPPVEGYDGSHFFKGNDIEQWGFIAHELQETMIPSAATGVKDQDDCIQSPNPWTIIAALTKTIQEMQARIEALEGK